MYYYEMMEPWTVRRPGGPFPPGYYFSDTHIGASVVPRKASRIWLENADKNVFYVKDNLSWDRAVDMREFAWIKLKAKSLRDFL